MRQKEGLSAFPRKPPCFVGVETLLPPPCVRVAGQGGYRRGWWLGAAAQAGGPLRLGPPRAAGAASSSRRRPEGLPVPRVPQDVRAAGTLLAPRQLRPPIGCRQDCLRGVLEQRGVLCSLPRQCLSRRRALAHRPVLLGHSSCLPPTACVSCGDADCPVGAAKLVGSPARLLLPGAESGLCNLASQRAAVFVSQKRVNVFEVGRRMMSNTLASPSPLI